VSPSTYIFTIPAVLVAVSAWLVHWENGRFFEPRRTAELQSLPRYSKSSPLASAAPERGLVKLNDPASRPLGNDLPMRGMGERAPRPRSWLATPPPAIKTGAELPPIPGYVEPPVVEDVEFTPVTTESGFHITSNEVSKLGSQTNRLHFSGNVKMTSPQFHLDSDQLIIRLGKDEAVEQADAAGHVQVRLVNMPPEKTFRAQSHKALYDPKAGKLTLTGWPKVQGKDREIVAAEEGARIFLYPQTGKLLTEGRTQTRVAKDLVETTKPAPTQKK
jgi:lipopolysaccharide transport protein LptA